jgi:tetratricopeptide (TPR) repeat protein
LYQFAEKGWPFVRMVAVILVLLGMTVYLSFHFLYRPLQAHIYYTQGLDLIEQDEYSEGFALFNKAFFGWGLGKLTIQGWPSKNRFLDYADAYRMRRAFPYAVQMYEGLLGEYPEFLRGYLEYGLFLTNKTGEYARSAEILSMGLNRDLYNYDLMLALGDNYMLWSEEDPDKLEDARFQYATALAHYDGNDEIMLRMLRYFLRIQDDSNISILSNIYSKKSGIKGDPAFTALTLSDLGGYYIDRNQVSEAKDFLFKAEEIDVSVPDVHYQLARYFRRTYNMDQEKKALQKALFYMDQAQPLSRSRIFKNVGIYRRRGEINYEEGLYDNAEEEFEAGIRLLEDSQLRGLIGTNSEIGELYADMGNLHYTVYDDLTGALNYFNKAEKNQYHTGDISYRKGYIYYDQKQYDQAVLEFESALKDMKKTRNTRFALANTLVYRHNFFGARNQYMEILRDLKREESSLPYLAPEDIIEHRSLVNHFIRVYNNLAYVDYSLAERGSDQVKQSQALLSLTRAADYADRIDRDPETMVRSRPEDSLVFQNTMAMIKPLPESDVYLYDEITRTPEELLSR